MFIEKCNLEHVLHMAEYEEEYISTWELYLYKFKNMSIIESAFWHSSLIVYE